VGAHDRHLFTARNAALTACNECHTVPATLSSAGHIDASPGAEVIFGVIAKKKTNQPGVVNYDPATPSISPNPVYNSATGTCANTYCHGTFKYGRQSNTVSWTTTTLRCGSCHGDGLDNPLPSQGGMHQLPFSANCQSCHADVISNVSGTTYTWANKAKHINGKLNVAGEERDF
jgi:predicted CxxxxCH...CXXCH cytochrome family protein